MSHAKAGPKELALRAQREEKAAEQRLIPYAGKEKYAGRGPNKGGRPPGSPNRPKQKAKR